MKLHAVAIVADVFDGEDVEPEVQGTPPAFDRAWGVVILPGSSARAYLEGGREPLAQGLDRTATKKGALRYSWKATTT